MKTTKHILLLNRGYLPKTKHVDSLRNYVTRLSVLLDQNGNDIFTRMGDRFFRLDLGDLESVWNATQQIQQECPIDGIVTFDEYNVGMVAELCEKLKLPGIDAATAYRCRNKWLMKHTWKQADLPVPRFRLVSDPKDFFKTNKDFSYPLVCKPIIGGGSEYVVCVRNAKELADAHQTIIQEVYQHFPREPFLERVEKEHPNSILIEEYLKGEEISVEACTFEGETTLIAIHDKPEVSEKLYFLSTYTCTPSNLPLDIQKKVAETVKKAMASLKITNGLSHTELKITPTGPYLLETGARLGGAGVNASIKNSLGIDMSQIMCDIATGTKPNMIPLFVKKVGFRQILGVAGKIKTIHGLEKLHGLSQIPEIQMYVQPGDIIRGKINIGSYGLGHIVVVGDNHTEMQRFSNEICSKIEFEYA